MKVLIVEDEETKRLRLQQFLEECLPDAVLESARSLRSGLRALQESAFNLVILDMTLPNFDAGPDESGGQTYPLGGREFLEQMSRLDIAAPVIVVTQFETFGKGSDQMNLNTLREELADEYGDLYRGAVYYNAAIHGWKTDLKKLIDIVVAKSE